MELEDFYRGFIAMTFVLLSSVLRLPELPSSGLNPTGFFIWIILNLLYFSWWIILIPLTPRIKNSLSQFALATLPIFLFQILYLPLYWPTEPIQNIFVLSILPTFYIGITWFAVYNFVPLPKRLQRNPNST